MSDPGHMALRKRQEPMGVLALALALILMILPAEGETLWMVHREGRSALERLIWFVCFLVVAIPLVASWCRVRCQPERWARAKENLILTANILALNLLMLLIALWCNVI